VGAVVEPFQLPLGEWVSWIQADRPEPTPSVPGVPPESSSGAAAGLHRLVPPEFRSRASAEALMIRLEALQVLLGALGSLIDALGREHGNVRPEDLWFRVAKDQPFVPLAWTAEPMLLDLAPDTARSAARVAPELRLRRGDSRRILLDGVLIPRGETTEGESRRGAKFMFIPEDKCETPPAEGSPLFVLPEKGKDAGHLEGYVENAFQDVFRVVVYLGDLGADALTDLVSSHGKSISLGLGTPPRGEANPDLYALGTIWYAMLRRGPFDLAAAASFRDLVIGEMTKAGIDPTDHAAAVRWCRQTGLESGGFIVHSRPGYDLSAAPEANILGRCIWIGVRLTTEIPGEGGIQATREAVRHLVREAEDLAEQARYLMLGRPSAAEEILGVVDLLEERELLR